ncbi:hypothetical protein MVEN_02347100 [Mycena venus]|uniref:Uncharacterized protein n=1 Tax=Mycena venus TaxID=2733690 RepID=A0A8H6X337_9AGAR|nr:hypothetical protein MVEN_02347100 [Mycena venus]
MFYLIDTETLDSSLNLMISFYSELAVVLLLYGIYLSLFLLSIYNFSRRQKEPGRKILTVFSCMMAVLGTIQVAIIVTAAAVEAHFVQQAGYMSGLNEPTSHFTVTGVENLIFTINSLVASSLFLYRCYVVWEFRWKAIIFPTVIMTCTYVVAILSAAQVTNPVVDPRIVYVLGGVTNITLTAFTAGRILWVQRAAVHAGLDNTVRRRYNTAIRILLESGAIYCIAAILLTITHSLCEDDLLFHYMVIGIAGQLENIIPTFTLVYVGLKNTADNDRTNGKDSISFNHQNPVCAVQPCRRSEWSILDIKEENEDDRAEHV